MKTSRPISTISFNTEPFLIDTLEKMRKAKIISFWTCILHNPEDDEGGKKYHWHLLIEPGKSPIEVNTFNENFIEPDTENEKPLKSLIFRISKLDDALLYFKHDEGYLAWKGQSRRYHYEWTDFITSDDDELYYRIKSINVDLNPYNKMKEAIKMGWTFQQYAENGSVPVQQYTAFNKAWLDLEYNLKGKLKRTGEKHE